MEELKYWENYKKQINQNKRYKIIHGKKALLEKLYKEMRNESLDLNNPKTFTEKINSHKLCNDKLLTICADKNEVRKYVAKKIGKKYLIPQYFCKKNIKVEDLENLPNKFVLKTTSGSSTNKIVMDKSKEDLNYLCKLMKEYQRIDYGNIWGEFYYSKIDNKILAEKIISEDKVDDYKIHCFRNNGEFKQIIEVIYETENGRRKNLYNTKWEKLDYVFSMETTDRVIEKPKKLSTLLKLSKKLSEDFSYVRTDFYIVDDKIYFGELTFVPTAGYAKFYPQEMNEKWGSYIGDKLVLSE